MTREIKFRAWDRANCGMTPDPFAWKNIMLDIIDEDGNFVHGKPEDRYVMMQYTGLHDRNGVEIYEGDILETRMHAGTVVRDVMRWNERDAGWSKFHPLDRFEVIGNVHENPDLLA